MRHSFHNHTRLCHHASGDVHDYIQEARSLGLLSIGMSDHIPLPDGRWPGVRMAMDELDGYIAQVEDAKTSFDDIEVFLGAECEWFEHYREFCIYLLEELNFDYLIGAAHFIPMSDGSFPGFSYLNSKEHLFNYTEHVLDVIQSGMFLYLAHPDIFHSGYQRWDNHAKSCSLEIIRCAKDHNLPLEINANGFRKPSVLNKSGRWVPEYPVREFWELAAAEGAETVIGSDAHAPEDLITCCDTCASWLDELGLVEVQDKLYRKVTGRLCSSDLPPAESLHTENQ